MLLQPIYSLSRVLVLCILLGSTPLLSLAQPSPASTLQARPRLGIQYSTNGSVDAWLTLGSTVYFVYEIGTKVSDDKSVYFPHVPLSTAVLWNDQRLEDVSRYLSWGVGAGKLFNNIGVHTTVNLVRVVKRYQFFDDTYFMTGGGKGVYTIPGHMDGHVTCKIGLIYETKFKLSIKSDYDPLRNDLSIGMGYIF